jgi:hypothetical protein
MKGSSGKMEELEVHILGSTSSWKLFSNNLLNPSLSFRFPAICTTKYFTYKKVSMKKNSIIS